ncbi:MAG: YgiT-type zinc finger protein [Anaerolineaceae bacterium]
MTDFYQEITFQCRECQAGIMRRSKSTYYTWLGNEMITVPDFPTWVCDVCHRREYDSMALNQLSLILSPTAGKSPHKNRRIAKKTQSKSRHSRTSQT